jgi:hypothetical protein
VELQILVTDHLHHVLVDDDPLEHPDRKRARVRLLSLQLEGSGQIWYRNVYVKRLEK